jgi:hypothetical protein
VIGGPAVVTVGRRSRGWELNEGPYDRDISMGGWLVRRAPYLDSSDPHWEPELGLYVWEEYGHDGSCHTFVADPTGRYRYWHAGEYVGTVPQAR